MARRASRSRRRRAIAIALGALVWVALSALSSPPASAREREAVRFRTGPSTADPLEIALAYVRDEAEELGLRTADLRDHVIAVRYRTAHNGVTHLVLRQRIHGIEVWNADLAVNVSRDGRILNIHNGFVEAAGARAPGSILTAELACARAGASLGLVPGVPITATRRERGPDRQTWLRSPRLSLNPIPARLMYWPSTTGDLRLVWNLNLRMPDEPHWWDLNVDAVTGEVLSRVDWARRESYRVFALPVQSPDDGARSLEVAPADPVVSPFGWHDTNGIAGAEFTDTRGNNVEAQDDANADNAGGARPSGGAQLDFDFPLDLTLAPAGYQAAAVSNAFHLANTLHDIHARYGFDAASGNFQRSNHGAGSADCPGFPGSGQGNDPVLVDVQDGALRNNAVFLTPPEGFSGRMELFVWTDGSAELDVSAPAAIAGTYLAGDAAFGALLTDSGIAGTVVQALDPADGEGPSTTDGCSPLTNAGAVAGNIALIDRGTCLFVDKVNRAEQAGASGTIIVNNQGNGVLSMGGGGAGDPEPSIPSLLIGQGDGDLLKAQLGAGVAAILRRDPTSVRDAALDNGTIVHEYGHGVTARLTGGKCTVSCVGDVQSAGMSEGWSDWHQLALTSKNTDTGADAQAAATYLLFQPQNGGGIRNFPYSTDLGVNPLIYSDIGILNQPHGVGEVWASALWEMTWNLVDDHGFDENLYTGSGGNNLALQLVMDGLKLQPCNPSFLDGRDAILTADLALGGANQCAIWEAFAKRGMGESADDGGSAMSLAVTNSFDVPVACPEAGAAAQRLAALGLVLGSHALRRRLGS